MDENKTNVSAKETESNGFNKDWYYSMLNLSNASSSNDEDKNKDDLWCLLEKEVAYMRSRLDVLEKIVMEGKRK